MIFDNEHLKYLKVLFEFMNELGKTLIKHIFQGFKIQAFETWKAEHNSYTIIYI